MSWWTERKLRAALEVGNSKELLRLCGQLDSNVEIKFRGLKQSVTHHVTRWTVSMQCLRLLIDRLGHDRLTCRNKWGETPVHLAARFKDDSWMQLIRDNLGKECFNEKTSLGETAAHYAAMNKENNATLRWLVFMLGKDCLAVPDSFGNTAVHFAAWFQLADSLQFIADQLGGGMFSLKNSEGQTLVDWVEKDTSNHRKVSKRAWVASQQWLPEAPQQQPMPRAAQTLPPSSTTTRPLNPPSVAVKPLPPLPDAAKPPAPPAVPKPLPPSPDAVRPPAPPAVPKPLPPSPDTVKPPAPPAVAKPLPPPPDAVKPPAPPAVPKPLPRPFTAATEPLATDSYEDGSSLYSSKNIASKPLDPSFTSWSIIKQDGKPQLLGEGGCCRVFRALTDRYQTVAVKIVPLSGDSRKQKTEIELEKRGLEILKNVKHPNIVQFLKCDLTSDGFCIFTELISGLSLAELMKQHEKPIEESGVRDFSRQICMGLDFLHHQPQGGSILHRDIKCSNIMLTQDGTIKLIDFGLAKEIINSCGLTTGNQARGTWHFMAPELFMADECSIPYSTKTDVWALGCTVYEMTEMQPPNGNVPVYRMPILIVDKTREMPQIAEKFSPDLREFYRMCVTREPQHRPDTSELLGHSFLGDSKYM